MSGVTIEHVSKRFGSVQAVKDISFAVPPGEIFGVLGPNGAGKTTTIRMLLDIYRPDSGKISVLGGPITAQTKQRIGYLPEERGLYKDLTVEQALVFLASLKGMTEQDARKALSGWLERLDLAAHRKKKIQELSKGMQQKAQIIATLLHQPDLIVIDEPFSGLDPVNTRLVKEILEEQRQQGKTILMCSHQMHQVEALCDRIAMFHHGQIVLYGSVAEIRRQYAGNIVRLTGSGDFSLLRGVTNSARENGDWLLTLAPGIPPQAWLANLADCTAIEVTRFEIASTSLEDIFVSVVQRESAYQEAV